MKSANKNEVFGVVVAGEVTDLTFGDDLTARLLVVGDCIDCSFDAVSQGGDGNVVGHPTGSCKKGIPFLVPSFCFAFFSSSAMMSCKLSVTRLFPD